MVQGAREMTANDSDLPRNGNGNGVAVADAPAASTFAPSRDAGPNDVVVKLNGDDIAAAQGETIIEAAQRHGVEIPHLCYTPGMRPDGNCRACMVEVKGERALAPSCCRKPAPG